MMTQNVSVKMSNLMNWIETLSHIVLKVKTDIVALTASSPVLKQASICEAIKIGYFFFITVLLQGVTACRLSPSAGSKCFRLTLVSYRFTSHISTITNTTYNTNLSLLAFYSFSLILLLKILHHNRDV